MIEGEYMGVNVNSGLCAFEVTPAETRTVLCWMQDVQEFSTTH